MPGRNNQGRAPSKGGLGAALMNSKANKRKSARNKQAKPFIHTTEEKLESVVDRSTLDDFLSDAVMKETNFEAERQNFQIVDASQQGPEIVFPHAKRRPDLYDYEDILVPRRPAWVKGVTTAEELDRDERDNFLDWRRHLARMEENSIDKKMTPFEKTLGIWRQLWRVLEKSDLICQIVDARNPLLFRSKDLDRYIAEMGDLKKTLIIINKADYLSQPMRQTWANYFKQQGIEFLFFSAVASQQELDEGDRQERLAQKEKSRVQALREDYADPKSSTAAAPDTTAAPGVILEEEAKVRDLTAIMSRNEMLDFFLEFMNWPESEAKLRAGDDNVKQKRTRLEVGMVGYPNVGKSSTINVLAGVKRVNVGATPGKTKHFQTLIISDDLMLVDCPGLVFPTFMESAASLYCNGILPIDHLRDFKPPIQEICRRISREQFAKTYSLDFPHWKQLTAHELCEAHARLRGFGQAHGEWDTYRSARILIKDFVVGKLLYCHPPPKLNKEQRTAFANSLVVGNEYLEAVLLRIEQTDAETKGKKGKAKSGPRKDVEAAVRGVADVNLGGDDNDEEDDGSIIPVNVGDVGNCKFNVAAVNRTIINTKPAQHVDLAVKKVAPPAKKLTKKQMRRQNKNNKNTRMKGRNAFGNHSSGNHGVHTVTVGVPTKIESKLSNDHSKPREGLQLRQPQGQFN